MSINIPANLEHKQEIMIDESLTVPSVSPLFLGFSDMQPVFATAYLVGFVEWTCVEALRPYLDADLQTVGTNVNLSHCAATPIGMKVTAEVKLIEISEKRLTFSVFCKDEIDVICKGIHERYIIDPTKFLPRIIAKVQSLQ